MTSAQAAALAKGAIVHDTRANVDGAVYEQALLGYDSTGEPQGTIGIRWTQLPPSAQCTSYFNYDDNVIDWFTAGSAGTVVASDAFESYPENSAILAPWTSSGPTRVYRVPTGPVHGALQSFAVGNGGSASTSTLPIPAQSSWTLDVWIYIDPNSGPTQYIGLKNSASGTGLVINAPSTGAVTAGKPGSPWAGISRTVTTGAWHHYVLTVVQALAGSASLTIDGTSAGTFSGDTRDSANNTTSNQVVAVGTGIGPSPMGEIYVDDLIVTTP